MIGAKLLAVALLMLAAPATAAQADLTPSAFGSADQKPAARPGAPAEPLPAERRVLVMLRMAPEHYRPSGDYGGGGGYGDAAAAQARRRLAARIARDNGLSVTDSWPMPILGIDCVVMLVPGDEPLQAVADRLSADRRIAWSQPMNRFTAQGAQAQRPNDRLFAAQPAARSWRLADLHRIATGQGVRVAVIDSMVDARHPDLSGQLVTVRDLVGASAHPPRPEAHGTAVAGIIGAVANNAMGIVGVAPGARMLGLRACWQRSATATMCDSLSLARALVFALENGVNVVNLSLTGPRDELIARLVAVGVRRGVAMVAAIDPATGGGFPAALPGVIAVASDGLAPLRAGVYNAPGRDVPTTEPDGRWDLVNGNSYAAAHVSGLLALARQVGGHRRLLLPATARAGGGTVDACATLLRAGAKADGRCRPGS